MAASVFASHPELRPYLLCNVHPTGRTIGCGSYGSVVEVAMPGGTLCAAKKVHDVFLNPREVPRDGIEKAAEEFVKECQFMSTLRHPNIVHFLGICRLPGSRIPALVMEKMVTGLHDILDPKPKPRTKPFIPVRLKFSILHNVASGVSFLHSHSPPIIHRDLSARNVLLNEGMVAKIADLGMARIMPSLRAAIMTKAPGASIYMPPEAGLDKSKYDTTIDTFSIGVLAIFTLSQLFPDPQPAAYQGNNGKMVGRTELERRESYMREVREQYGKEHPIIKMIKLCLKNKMSERPKISEVLEWLVLARDEAEVGFNDDHKLALLQALVKRDEHIALRKEQNEIQKEQLEYHLARVKSLEEQVRSLQAEVEELKRPQKTPPNVAPKPRKRSQSSAGLFPSTAPGIFSQGQSLVIAQHSSTRRLMVGDMPIMLRKTSTLKTEAPPTSKSLPRQATAVPDPPTEQEKEAAALPSTSTLTAVQCPPTSVAAQFSSTRCVMVGDVPVMLRKTPSSAAERCSRSEFLPPQPKALPSSQPKEAPSPSPSVSAPTTVPSPYTSDAATNPLTESAMPIEISPMTQTTPSSITTGPLMLSSIHSEAPAKPPLDQAQAKSPLDQAQAKYPLDQAQAKPPLVQAPAKPPLDQAQAKSQAQAKPPLDQAQAESEEQAEADSPLGQAQKQRAPSSTAGEVIDTPSVHLPTTAASGPSLEQRQVTPLPTAASTPTPVQGSFPVTDAASHPCTGSTLPMEIPLRVQTTPSSVAEESSKYHTLSTEATITASSSKQRQQGKTADQVKVLSTQELPLQTSAIPVTAGPTVTASSVEQRESSSVAGPQGVYLQPTNIPDPPPPLEQMEKTTSSSAAEGPSKIMVSPLLEEAKLVPTDPSTLTPLKSRLTSATTQLSFTRCDVPRQVPLMMKTALVSENIPQPEAKTFSEPPLKKAEKSRNTPIQVEAVGGSHIENTSHLSLAEEPPKSRNTPIQVEAVGGSHIENATPPPTAHKCSQGSFILTTHSPATEGPPAEAKNSPLQTSAPVAEPSVERAEQIAAQPPSTKRVLMVGNMPVVLRKTSSYLPGGPLKSRPLPATALGPPMEETTPLRVRSNTETSVQGSFTSTTTILGSHTRRIMVGDTPVLLQTKSSYVAGGPLKSQTLLHGTEHPLEQSSFVRRNSMPTVKYFEWLPTLQQREEKDM